MEQNSDVREIRLLDFFAVLKRCWLIMLIVFVVAFSALFTVATVTYRPLYSATSAVYFLSNSSIMQDGQNNSAYYQLEIAAKLAEDCLEMLELEDQVILPVLTRLQEQGMLLDTDVDHFREMITYRYDSGERFVYFTITNEDPSTTAKICNELTEQIVTSFNQAQTDGTWKIVQTVNSAKMPTEPSNSVAVWKIGLISLVAAIAVYGIYLVLFWFNDCINTPEDVEKYLDLHVLGVIPNLNEKKGSRYGAYRYETNDAARNKGGKKKK